MEEIQIILPAQADETNPLEFGLIALTEAIATIDQARLSRGILGGEFGYGADWENDVFFMKPYCWCGREGECPWCTGCGAYETTCQACMDKHHNACFQNELQRRFAHYDEQSGYNLTEKALHSEGTVFPPTTERTPFGLITTSGLRTPEGEQRHKLWCKAHDLRTNAHTKLTKALYIERRIKPTLSQWYCDCGAELSCAGAREAGLGCDYHNGSGRIFAKFVPWTLDHERHYYDPPNFWHKPSGFRACWYKWIGRDMVTNRDIDIHELRKIFSECAASLPVIAEPPETAARPRP
jgi:hypothetical protein